MWQLYVLWPLYSIYIFVDKINIFLNTNLHHICFTSSPAFQIMKNANCKKSKTKLFTNVFQSQDDKPRMGGAPQIQRLRKSSAQVVYESYRYSDHEK